MELGELKGETSLRNPVQAASSESTKIEQARAFAEVAMQVELAKRYPRNMVEVFRRIEETFERSPGLLLKAKWKPFKRGSQEISGFTIQFARAIAECVGNIKYSFRELSRSNNQSEMMIYAWDMETNTIQDRTIIVPHTRDKTDYKTKKPITEALVHERDIYENNSNVSSRRLRECIFGVLPAAARRKGEEVVEELLRKAFPEEKRQQYIDQAIATLGAMGVSREVLIKERGNRPPETWTRNDIIALKNYAEDIKNGDMTAEDIFSKNSRSAVNDTTEPAHTPSPKKKAAPTPKSEPVEEAPKDTEIHEQVELSAHVAHLQSLFNNPDYASTFSGLESSGELPGDEIRYCIANNLEKSAIEYLAIIERGM